MKYSFSKSIFSSKVVSASTSSKSKGVTKLSLIPSTNPITNSLVAPNSFAKSAIVVFTTSPWLAKIFVYILSSILLYSFQKACSPFVLT